MLKSKILLIVTGSISAYKSLDLISLLKKDGHPIKVVMTASAGKFVTPLTFSALTEGEVYSNLFDNIDPMSHIELTRWADKIVVAPATANYINKISSGIADDLASNIYLSHKFDKPFIIYPAMNTAMLEHPQTKLNLKKLHSFGISIGETDTGVLACGEVGYGKLLHVDKIFNEIKSQRDKQIKNTPRILITSGGTREPIDGVRHIGNMSSGSTGVSIAESLRDSGFEVTFLHGKQSLTPKGCILKEFSSFESLDLLLKKELALNEYDYIIHLAAISDFHVDHLQDSEGNKVDTAEKISSKMNYSIHLKKNPKLIVSLKQYSKNKKVKIIGFKLTHTNSLAKIEKAIESVFNNPAVDFVVHNNLNDIKKDSHRFMIHSKLNKKVTLETKEELGMAIRELVKNEDTFNEVRI